MKIEGIKPHKKNYKTKPTRKQRLAFVKTLENSGNKSKALMEAGYSAAIAKNPKTITESKGWKQLIDEYLPDELLAQRHQELLNKQEIIIVKDRGVSEAIPTGMLDATAVKGALDMAYKIKGAYKADNEQKKPSVVVIADKRKSAIKKALEDL